MKKIILMLSIVFVACLSLNIMARSLVINHTTEFSKIVDNPEKKPCSKDCTCDKCKAKASSETTATSDSTQTTGKTACTKGESGCKKGESGCCKKKTSEEPKEEKKQE